MKKYIVNILLVSAAALTGLQAGSEKTFKEKVVIVETCPFRDYELQIDGFFAGVVGGGRQRQNNVKFHGGVGGGTGLNIYFLRYFGIGAEAFWYGNGGAHRENAEHCFQGTFQIRYPICSWRLAPYGLVGGGAWLDGRAVGNVQVGGGLEWRIWDHVGIFVDGRGVIMQKGYNSVGLLRSGIRFAF